MGIGAAYAFYEQNSDWLDDPEEAYDVLYGDDEEDGWPTLEELVCPDCLATGSKATSHVDANDCETCSGTGFVPNPNYDPEADQ